MIKKLAIVVATVAFAASGFAQGVVANSNRDLTRGVDAPVYLADGVTGLTSGYNMMLLGGADPSSLAPISGVSAFRDGTGAGYWNSPVGERTDGVAVPGVVAGETATFQVVAWDGSLGTYEQAVADGRLNSWGASAIFTAVTGSPASAGPPAVPAAPTALVGLTSFNLVPEPTTVALGLMGLGLVALRLRKK